MWKKKSSNLRISNILVIGDSESPSEKKITHNEKYKKSLSELHKGIAILDEE